MPRVSASATVPANIDNVFAFVADYRNITRLQPHFTSARLVGEIERGVGAVLALHGHFHGLPMHANTRIIAFDPPSRMVSISEGSVLSRSTWEFRPDPADPGKTHASLTIDYKFAAAGGILGGMAHKLASIFSGEIQHMTDASMHALQAEFAGGTQGATADKSLASDTKTLAEG